MRDLNTEALRRIDDIAFDCTIPIEKRLLMVQDTLYSLQEMQAHRAEEDYRAFEQSFVEALEGQV